jgi:N-acetylmuramoyl-L-alanine amidase
MSDVPLIVITGGHDRREVGSTQADGGREYQYTLPLSQEVRDALLSGWDCSVQLTHETDAPLTQGGDLGAELYARANLANKLGAAFYLSLHHDAGPAAARGGSLYIHSTLRSYRGQITRAYPEGAGDLVWLDAAGHQPDGTINHDAPRSYEMAQLGQPIVKETLAELGIPWRGVIQCADFAELRIPNCPCWLIETHFGSNPQDDAIMDQPGNRRQLAHGIARAVAVALKLKAKAPAPAPAPTPAPVVSGIGHIAVVLLDGRTVQGELRGQTTYIKVGEQWLPLRPVASAVGAVVDYVDAAHGGPRVEIRMPQPAARAAVPVVG